MTEPNVWLLVDICMKVKQHMIMHHRHTHKQEPNVWTLVDIYVQIKGKQHHISVVHTEGRYNIPCWPQGSQAVLHPPSV